MSSFFFFNDTATTEIYTLSLHDALPIWSPSAPASSRSAGAPFPTRRSSASGGAARLPAPSRAARGRAAILRSRSEEHTSELQSRLHLVCRLLLETKK